MLAFAATALDVFGVSGAFFVLYVMSPLDDRWRDRWFCPPRPSPPLTLLVAACPNFLSLSLAVRMLVECTVSSTESSAMVCTLSRRLARDERDRLGRNNMAHPKVRVVTARRSRGLCLVVELGLDDDDRGRIMCGLVCDEPSEEEAGE